MKVKVTKKEIKLKDLVYLEIELEDALTATQKILAELEKQELKDKIFLLKLYGKLKKGKNSDINYQEIQDYLEKKEVYSFLKNTSKLEQAKTEEIQIDLQSKEMEKVVAEGNAPLARAIITLEEDGSLLVRWQSQKDFNMHEKRIS